MNNKQYLSLISEVNHHNYLYFNKANPEITDSEYDKLYFKIEEYEKENPSKIDKNSPTQIIGSENINDSKKIEHPFKLLSLEKANTFDKVEKFVNKFNKNTIYQTDEFMIQLKEDGLTIALYYNWFDKKPFIAATRGKGSAGEDVSNALTFLKTKNVPKKPIVIRGEVILTNDQFEKYNNDNEYSSARNTIAGLIRSDKEINDITFIAYNIENAEDLNISSQKEMLATLEKWGFQTPALQKLIPANNPKLVTDFIDDFTKTNQRQTIDHEIDGLVIKPNNIKNRNEYGFTGHHPRGQLAYKFESPDAITTLKDVKWQIGASGRLTPVGYFDTIELLGANISKATLSNYDVIEQKDIQINDKILVKRSNDVIPYIVKSYHEKRNGSEEKIEIPKNSYFNGKYLMSKNISTEQLLNKWMKFVSEQGINIKNLSKKTIEQLSENNLIDLTDFTSLWLLPNNKDQLLSLDKWSNTKTNNLLNQLVLKKDIPLANILSSLSIPRVGYNTSKEITKSYPTFKSLENNKPISPLADRWLKPLENIMDNIDIIKNIIDNSNLNIITPKKSISSNQFQNETFVITGKSENYSRKDIQKIIESKGGSVSNTVTNKTTCLIDLSPETTSTKTKKAIKLNIKIINTLDEIL